MSKFNEEYLAELDFADQVRYLAHRGLSHQEIIFELDPEPVDLLKLYLETKEGKEEPVPPQYQQLYANFGTLLKTLKKSTGATSVRNDTERSARSYCTSYRVEHDQYPTDRRLSILMWGTPGKKYDIVIDSCYGSPELRHTIKVWGKTQQEVLSEIERVIWNWLDTNSNS